VPKTFHVFAADNALIGRHIFSGTTEAGSSEASTETVPLVPEAFTSVIPSIIRPFRQLQPGDWAPVADVRREEAAQLEAAGSSRVAIARQLGVTPGTVANWLGTHPPEVVIKRLISHAHRLYQVPLIRTDGPIGGVRWT